jgi:hypothetical protein
MEISSAIPKLLHVYREMDGAILISGAGIQMHLISNKPEFFNKASSTACHEKYKGRMIM